MNRLLLPYFLWPIIYLVVYSIISIFLLNPISIPLSAIVPQFLLGEGTIDPVLWYQFDLIVLTCFMFLLFNLFSKKICLSILVLLFFTCFAMQYTSINYNFFLLLNILLV